MTKHCKECGKFAMGNRVVCGRCLELIEERSEREKLAAQISELNGQMAAMKRYRVHSSAFQNGNGDLTWPEAVSLADKWTKNGTIPWRVQIIDERNRIIRSYEWKDGAIVKVEV